MTQRHTAWILIAMAAALVAWLGPPPAHAAEPFAPIGAKATLSVEYRFQAQGRRQDKHDLHEWRVRRDVDVVAELEAKKPAPLPQLQPMDATQTARIEREGAQVRKAHAEMAPMMADAQAILAKCGDDEKCMEREAMKMGAAMSGTAKLENAKRVGNETAAVLQPGDDRYQRWQARSQKGRYAADELWHVVHADPICMSLPKARCTHDMTRKGSGELANPKAGIGMVEFDRQAGTISLVLPAPLEAIEVTETHTTDEPEGTHDTAVPKAPRRVPLAYRAAPEGQSGARPLTVPLKGGWRSQSGELTIPMAADPWHGAPGDGGKLMVKWSFVAR